jgi:hypothetical protein
MISEEVPMNRFGLLLVLLFLLSAVNAGATQQGQSALRSFKIMDACAKQAQTAFPDFNADSNAKRDAKLKACLNANGLPPREPLAQPGPR